MAVFGLSKATRGQNDCLSSLLMKKGKEFRFYDSRAERGQV